MTSQFGNDAGSGTPASAGSLKRWVKPEEPIPVTCKEQYANVHEWMRRRFGRASEYWCSRRHCTEAARHWALDHELPSVLYLTLSMDASHYRPLCISHHRKLDFWAYRQARVLDLLSRMETLAPELLDDVREMCDAALAGLSHRPRVGWSERTA